MKKISLLIIIIISSLLLVSCTKKELVVNETDTIKIDLKKDNIKIMQLTDVHLTYGFDALDKKTYRLIDKLIEVENPDIIIITGDLFMTLYAKPVFKKFIKFIDSYDIPWSLTFGNHESEFHSMESIVKILLNAKTKNLYFLNNPNLIPNKDNGYSNFKLKIMNDDKEILNLYLLDSKVNRRDGIKDNNNPYDYLNGKQVGWYSNHLKEDLVSSLLFVHMPLRQYLLYEGPDRYEKSWPQAEDTKIYEAMTSHEIGLNKALGVFVGHDHLNAFDFYLENDNVMLAYGLSTGYNGYGNRPKGARIIEFNYLDNAINSYIVSDKEIGLWK